MSENYRNLASTVPKKHNWWDERCTALAKSIWDLYIFLACHMTEYENTKPRLEGICSDFILELICFSNIPNTFNWCIHMTFLFDNNQSCLTISFLDRKKSCTIIYIFLHRRVTGNDRVFCSLSYTELWIVSYYSFCIELCCMPSYLVDVVNHTYTWDVSLYFISW